jgi:hypothetical protein
MIGSTAPLILLLLMSYHLSLDRVIARIGPHVVRYREIGCDPSTITSDVTRLGGKTAAEICQAAEQAEFHGVVRRLLVDEAARKHNIALTAAEQLESVPVKFRDPKRVSVMTESKRLQAVAALRVIRGEDRQTVFREELSDDALAAKGILDLHFPSSALDDAMRFFHDERDVQRRLDALSDERTLREMVEYFSGGELARRIRRIIAERAALSKTAPEVAQEIFWKEIMAEMTVEIIDPHYTMPELKGLV